MCESSVRHWAGNTLARQTKSPPPGNWSLGTTVFPSKDLMLINVDCWSPLPSFQQNLCPTHCFFFFYEKQSSTSLHEWRSCWEIFPIECAPGKTWQHTQCTLPFSLGAPATPQDLPRSLPNWQRRALQWHLLLKNQYSEKHKSSRRVETISSSSSSSFLPFYRSQIFLKISGLFQLPVPKRHARTSAHNFPFIFRSFVGPSYDRISWHFRDRILRIPTLYKSPFEL